MIEADDAGEDEHLPLELVDPDDGEDEGPAPAHSWLGAIGQMVAALLVVVALVVLFIGAAAALRRLLP